MKRIAVAVVLVGLFIFANNPGLAQTGGKEAKVRYRLKDTGKTDSINGVIQEESLEGISIKGPKGVTKIPAQDILDVDYLEYLPVGDRPAARKAQTAEKANKYEEAIGLYQKLKPADKKAARHFEYRIAANLALQADSGGETKPAITALEKYMANHPDSWQMINVPKLLIPLQLHEKDVEGAQKTLKALDKAKIPDSLRQELNAMKSRSLMEAGKYDEAEKALADLIKGTKDEAQVFRLRIQLADCMASNKQLPKAKAELQDIISKTNNPDMKAFALNTLGECCRKNGDNREAMWNFLYVDVLYNQNKEEHNRAIKNLAEVFEKLNDPKKAKQYADMLKGK
jgi:tetratricopeptide (TPR) repeat protein